MARWPGFPSAGAAAARCEPVVAGLLGRAALCGCRLRSKVLGLHLLESASMRRNANHLSKAIAAHLHHHYRRAHPQSLQAEGAPAMTGAPSATRSPDRGLAGPDRQARPATRPVRTPRHGPLPRRGPGAALPADQPVRPGDRRGAAISVNTVKTPVPETRRAQPHTGRRAGSRPRPTHTICLSNEHRKPAI
jgi:hypothetical protein